ncbi:MAG: hypothetical protein U0R24_10300 [Solirubrobacterales bacterium]
MASRGQIRAGVVSALALALAMLSSLIAGTPRSLPEIALGSAPLLHVERAAAVLALLGMTLVIVWRASRGQLPIRFANVEYESEVAAEHDDQIANLNQRVVVLEIAAQLRGTDDLEDGDTGA